MLTKFKEFQTAQKMFSTLNEQVESLKFDHKMRFKGKQLFYVQWSLYSV